MSSFASKTHSKLSQFRSSRAAALENYSGQFQKFSSVALKQFSTYDNVYHWANSQAKKFLALNPTCPHNALAVAHDLRQVYASQPARRIYVLVDESQNTLGNKEIAFLYKEFDLWYSAFEVEAEEEGGLSAANRWLYQTCQKLSRRTGLTMAQLDGDVSSWLEKRLSA
jgi:hypothetical protein